MANLRVELGPCDDKATFSINGIKKLSVNLNETDTFQQVLTDGSYHCILNAENTDSWSWKYDLRLLVDGEVKWHPSDEGWESGLSHSTFRQEFSFTIRDGKYADF